MDGGIQPTVTRTCERVDYTGRHDWRVRPDQVIYSAEVEGRLVSQVLVVCACCNEHAMKNSRRRFTNNPDDPRTWRPYLDGD